jgi:hypothetical protein
MAPTTIYVKPMLELLRKHDIPAMAHITGGGLTENIIRVIPEGLGLDLEASAIVLPPVFDWLQREGAVPREEMWRTFNCGVGFVLVLAPGEVAAVSASLDGSASPTAESAAWSRAIRASASASSADPMPRGWKAVAFGATVLVFLLTWIHPRWPLEQAMHSSLAVLGLAWLLVHDRRWPMGTGAFVAICLFIAVHSIAAHWLYSNVPYDDWFRARSAGRRRRLRLAAQPLRPLHPPAVRLCFAPALAQYAARAGAVGAARPRSR